MNKNQEEIKTFQKTILTKPLDGGLTFDIYTFSNELRDICYGYSWDISTVFHIDRNLMMELNNVLWLEIYFLYDK